MALPLLQSKLFVAPTRPSFVPRPRLLNKLNEGLHRKLTLISAPAGFGKTTLVSEWIATCGRPAAWLSLDEGDSDLARFLMYLIAALQTLDANSGTAVLAVLQSPPLPPTEAILTHLINDITTLSQDCILVLDDYHLIEARAVDEALAFLVEHLPRRLHLVITTREDPPLPLSRLRARGQLTEVRAADLRFTAAEAADFLNQVMGLSLSTEQIAALESRTEGWIAGLQLAALSMQGHHDIPGFIRAFAGNHRYIVDYLVEEVLQRQPEAVRTFLLQTSILDRLHGSLCNAVTGQVEGSAHLQRLERGNLFVVPLDDNRLWFRNHHLFAEVLYAHLMAEQPAQLPMLHRRASQWYADNGMPADAIRHALAAGDHARAADLIELALPDMRRRKQERTLLGWFKAIPDHLMRTRPVLSMHAAGTLMSCGEMEDVDKRLADAEQWLVTGLEAGATSSTEMVVVDKEAWRTLPGWLAIHRAGYALARGDVAETMKHAQRAIDLAPDDDLFGRGAAVAFLGLALWTSGDLEAAHRTYAEGMASVQKAGFVTDAIGGAVSLADIRIAQGRLREAMKTYQQGLQLATGQGAMGQSTTVLRGAADMHVGMAELFREYNDLEAATQQLLKSKELGEFAGLGQNPYRWCVAMARIRQAQGDLEGALTLLDEAERVYFGDFSPNVRPIAAAKARVWIAQGNVEQALEWAQRSKLSVEDDLSYLHEFEHITLARALLARAKGNPQNPSFQEAVRLLNPLLHAAEEGGRRGSLCEILVMQSLAHSMQDDTAAALATLERALTVAEPEGYVRIFIDEGPPLARLLEKASQQGIAPTYVGRLLAAFGITEQSAPTNHNLPTHDLPAQPLHSANGHANGQREITIEPLSERELDVLRLLATELSGPEMADKLMVSLNTLRTHTKNIYSKLEVNNRRAATRRAEELNLL